MGACELATKYYEKMSKCKTIEELFVVGQEIKADEKNLEGWIEWLRDGYKSISDTIKAPIIPIEDMLNKEGLRALARGEI